MKKNLKIGLVVPWFGKFCTGGAENFARQLAKQLIEADVFLEILTTCVRDFTANWNHNYYSQGFFVEDGFNIRRFPVKPGNHKIFQTLVRLINCGVLVNETQQNSFIGNSVRSLALENFLKEHKSLYDFFIFIPYLYGTTYFGIEQVPEKAILIGCLHNEPYAKLGIFKKMYQKVKGLVYLSPKEKELAEKLYGVGGKPSLIGGAVELPIKGNAEVFREKFKIKDDFILYLGRKDEGKNLPLLVNYFLRYKKEVQTDLKLILIGAGKLKTKKIGKADELGRAAESLNCEIIDLGVLSETDKAGALSAARFLVQPSINESFSIVVMEAWLNSKPVLIHGACEVTCDFVKRSQGGLFFKNYLEFKEAINFLLTSKEVAEKMGVNGKKFVEENLLWEKVIKKYLEFFEFLKQN